MNVLFMDLLESLTILSNIMLIDCVSTVLLDICL